KGWMLVKYINNVARFLSQAFREAAFPFNQAITGTPQLPTQIKQAYRLANSAFDEVVGIFYGQKYFGAKAKKDVEDMIRKMLKVYEERIKSNTWLSAETKKKAVVKLKDRKSRRLHSSHVSFSYAVFCLKKKTCKSQNYSSI